MGAGVDQYATREIVTTLRGKAPEAGNVGMGRGRSGFHFHTPCAPSASDDEIHFHLIFVPIMPEIQVWIGPASLGRQLLEDEGFQQVAEAVPLVMPVLDSKVGERGGKAAVNEVQLRRLDEPLGGVAMPRL